MMFSSFLAVSCPKLILPDGKPITIRSGKYLANDLLSIRPRKAYKWIDLKSTKAHIQDITARFGLELKDLYCPQGGRSGTLIHPVMVLCLAKWLHSSLYDCLSAQIRAAFEASRGEVGAAAAESPKEESGEVGTTESPKEESDPDSPYEVAEMPSLDYTSSDEDESHDAVYKDLIEANAKDWEHPHVFKARMTFSRFSLRSFHRRKVMIDPKFLDFYTSKYRNLSTRDRETKRCIKLEVLLEMGVYTEIFKAKQILIANYEKKDYVVLRESIPTGGNSRSDKSSESEACGSKDGAEMRDPSRPGPKPETILLTPNCFRDMCIQVQNEARKKIRRYYMLLEDTVHEFMIYEREYSDAVAKHYLEQNREMRQELALEREEVACSRDDADDSRRQAEECEEAMSSQTKLYKETLIETVRESIEEGIGDKMQSFQESLDDLLDGRFKEWERDMRSVMDSSKHDLLALKQELRSMERRRSLGKGKD